MMHSKLPVAMLGTASALVLALSPSAALAHDGGGGGGGHGHNLLRGDLTPSLPTDAAINLIPPGGAPWILGRGEVRVRESGRMDVRIEGLQIPRNGAADNPVANIHAVLYCSGAAAADSGSQPMSVPGGDSRFRVSLMVPETCPDAVVLIQPDSPLTPGTRANAYIASVMAAPDDDED